MRNGFRLFCTFALLQSVANVYATDEIELIWRTVHLYQADSRQMYGHEMGVEIFPNQSVNAYPAVSDGKPRIVFYSAILEKLSDDMVVAATCHELGHHLGFRAVESQEFADEGDSDYFAGACLAHYLRTYERLSRRDAEEVAEAIATATFSTMYKTRLVSDCARESRAGRVIRGEYPSPDCRVLTYVHGAKEWRRPECWYDPSN
jgi:hypothetical protein